MWDHGLLLCLNGLLFLENINLWNLTKQFLSQLSIFESQIAKLRADVEKGEAMRQSLEYELAISKKEAGLERYSVEYKLCEANKQIEQLQGRIQSM